MNEIHPTAIIGDRVILGEGNKILPYTIILGPTEIGNANVIGPHVVIGSPGQDTKNPRYDSTNSFIKIGSRNIIREFTAIQKPCYADITSIGDDVYLMQGVHIPHDALIMDNVVITPMCVLAGITRILKAANLGMGATVNQYAVIGQYSIIATGSAVMKCVKPFSKYIPNKSPSVNTYALKKFGLLNFEKEITNYVLSDIPPVSPIICDIIDEFIKYQKESKLDIYI